MSKITPEQVEAQIADTRYYYDGLVTIAVVECMSGFKSVGHATAVAETHYSREEGEKWARAAALKDIYTGMAYERWDTRYHLATCGQNGGGGFLEGDGFTWATPSEAL